MKRYSISDVEKLTGIKAHTIRIWEQRYNLLEPHRTDTNIRYYDEGQLKLLLNVALLLNKGHKISKVSSLSNDELNDEVKKIYEESVNDFSDYAIHVKINHLVLAMLELDESRFEKIFNTSILKRGLENTITKVIYPFLQRMGIMWRTGEVNTAQEHFMYYLIRQKIMVAVDAVPLPKPDAERYLLFMPESEFDDLFILISTYLLKTVGKKIVNLGQDIEISDLPDICKIVKPSVLMTFIPAKADPDRMIAYVDQLTHQFPDLQICVCGALDYMTDHKWPKNVEIINNLDELKTFAA